MLGMNVSQEFFHSLSTAAAVSNLVGAGEDLHFEAKTCSVPLDDRDKNNLARALSGFANADGGVLIYGLEAKGGDRHKADVVTRVSPVCDIAKAHSEVVSLVGQLVEPRVDGVDVRRFSLQHLPDSGFILVYVPASSLGPHRSRRDREYHRRHGSGFFRMEHYEIAEMFGRRLGPELRIRWELRQFDITNAGVGIARISLGIENVGRATAKYPCLTIKHPNHQPFAELPSGLSRRTSFDRWTTIFGGSVNDVIYPASVLDITVFQQNYQFDATNPAVTLVELEYSLSAEDMETFTGTLRITGSDCVGKRKPAGAA